MTITPPEFFQPATRDEMWRLFDQNPSFGKHYPLLYSMVRGTGAKKAIDIGIGKTTAVMRAAMEENGGVLYSCDFDEKRFANLLESQTDKWRLSLCDSAVFIASIEAPIDFACHDGAHDFAHVRRDLRALIPKMRKLALICVHDTQVIGLAEGMLLAIEDIAREFPITYTHLPYSCGLTLIRVEDSVHPPLPPPDANTTPLTLVGSNSAATRFRASIGSKRVWLSGIARALGLGNTGLANRIRERRRRKREAQRAANLKERQG